MALLSLRSLRAWYGPVRVLHDVEVELGKGEVVALLGRNGAGKSTLLRAVSRLVRTEGSISFAGRDLTGMAADAVAGLGVAHVPEGRGTFPELIVAEHLELAARAHSISRAVKALKALPSALSAGRSGWPDRSSVGSRHSPAPAK